MAWGQQRAAMALDGAAAAIFAAAAAFAASAVESGALAALIAPVAFVAAYAVLGQVDGARAFPLSGFELQPLGAPDFSVGAVDDGKVVRLEPRQPAIARPSQSADGNPQDAGQALIDALAALKQALR